MRMHLIRVSTCPILLPCSHLTETATAANNSTKHYYNLYCKATQEDCSNFLVLRYGECVQVVWQRSGHVFWFLCLPSQASVFLPFLLLLSTLNFTSHRSFIAFVEFFHTSHYYLTSASFDHCPHPFFFLIHCLFFFSSVISFILLPVLMTQDDPRAAMFLFILQLKPLITLSALQKKPCSVWMSICVRKGVLLCVSTVNVCVTPS